MTEHFLLDTNILVEYLRGRYKAAQYLENLKGYLFISSISVAELFVGLKTEEEQSRLEQFLISFQVIPVDEKIAKVGGLIRRDYAPRYGTSLADSLIAATAQIYNATLVTFNIRHFPMLTQIHLPYHR